jgi:hypothetical protein
MAVRSVSCSSIVLCGIRVGLHGMALLTAWHAAAPVSQAHHRGLEVGSIRLGMPLTWSEPGDAERRDGGVLGAARRQSRRSNLEYCWRGAQQRTHESVFWGPLIHVNAFLNPLSVLQGLPCVRAGWL